MRQRRTALASWLVCTIALFLVPGPEVEMGRTRDGDVESVTVMDLTGVLGVASLGIGLLGVVLVVLWRKRA